MSAVLALMKLRQEDQELDGAEKLLLAVYNG